MILIDVHIPKNNGNVIKEWERLEFECNDWKRREIKKMMDATVTTIFFSLKRVKMLEILCVQRILMAEFENFSLKTLSFTRCLKYLSLVVVCSYILLFLTK